MKLNDAIEAWIASRTAMRRLNPTSERTYRFHIQKMALSIGPDTPIENISPRDIHVWLATMTHLKANSLKTATEPARSLFRWAVDEELIDRDPMRKIPRPKMGPPEYRAIDPGDLARLLHVADHRDRTIVLLGLHLALRCCEMSRADVTDWDRRRGWLSVRGKGYNGDISRVIPIEGEVEWVLDMWIDGRRAGPLFPSQHAERLSPNSISQRFTALARRAHVQATHHQCRHTCAHHLVDLGSRPNAVQRFLGHRHWTSTEVYWATRDDQLLGLTARAYLPSGPSIHQAAA